MVGSADAGSGSGTLDTAKSTSVAGSVTFKGDYNANSNSPNLDLLRWPVLVLEPPGGSLAI